MINSEAILGLPDYEITAIEQCGREIRLQVRYTGLVQCPDCGSGDLRLKDRRVRHVRHVSWGQRHCVLELDSCKWLCRNCGRYFQQRFPGILPWQRSTEHFRQEIFELHFDGINRSRLGRRKRIGAATVERHFQHFLWRQAAEREGATCPRVLGIDEHFFSRKHGYATTFCDLAKHKVYDVVLGRSEAALEKYLSQLQGKEKVRIVCMDLCSAYRSVVRKHFRNAVIVADRFHVVRLVNQHFLALWRQLDPVGAKNRGLLSLMRRHAQHLSEAQKGKLAAYLACHPALEAAYQFKQRLVALLLVKHRKAKHCRKLIPQLLGAIDQLQTCGFSVLATLGNTIASWREEIARMWRFTRSNGITEGFHTKMEVLQRQAYGFRNFKNYRLRVVVMC